MDRKNTRRTSNRGNTTLSRESAHQLGLKLEQARAEEKWAAKEGKDFHGWWAEKALRKAKEELGPIEPLESLVPGLLSAGKRVVVLEDKQSRLDLFQRWFGGHHDLVQTAVIREGIELLREKKADVLFLDFDVHDKGDRTLREWLRVEQWRKELDGLDLATYAGWLKPEHRPETVVVHSRNPIGQRMLLKHLQKKDFKPVRWPFHYEWVGLPK